MRPKEPLTVKVFSPCGLIGGPKLSKSVLDKTRVSKKEENLFKCPPSLRTTQKHNTQELYQLELRTLDCRCYGSVHTKTIIINDTVCAVFYRTRLI